MPDVPDGFISKRHRHVSKDRVLLKRLEALVAEGRYDGEQIVDNADSRPRRQRRASYTLSAAYGENARPTESLLSNSHPSCQRPQWQNQAFFTPSIFGAPQDARPEPTRVPDQRAVVQIPRRGRLLFELLHAWLFRRLARIPRL